MKFVPADKLSKKKKRELDSSRRNTWTTDPRPRIVESKKRYSRKRKNKNEGDCE
jgi:hypothetical protein